MRIYGRSNACCCTLPFFPSLPLLFVHVRMRASLPTSTCSCVPLFHHALRLALVQRSTRAFMRAFLQSYSCSCTPSFPHALGRPRLLSAVGAYVHLDTNSFVRACPSACERPPTPSVAGARAPARGATSVHSASRACTGACGPTGDRARVPASPRPVLLPPRQPCACAHVGRHARTRDRAPSGALTQSPAGAPAQSFARTRGRACPGACVDSPAPTFVRRRLRTPACLSPAETLAPRRPRTHPSGRGVFFLKTHSAETS